MAAGKRDLYIEQGATFTLTVTWKQDATTPYNLTGCTARMQLREKIGLPVLINATTATGEITLGGAAGTIVVKISDEQTDTLTVKKAVYDLEVEWPNGDVDRVLQGAVTIDPNVTRTP